MGEGPLWCLHHILCSAGPYHSSLPISMLASEAQIWTRHDGNNPLKGLHGRVIYASKVVLGMWDMEMGQRTADCGCGRARVDLHLERAAVEDMLVEEFLTPHRHCSTCHLDGSSSSCQHRGPDKSSALASSTDRHSVHVYAPSYQPYQS